MVTEETATPEPLEGQVMVQIKAAALNHRDLWIQKGSYHNKEFPCILGSDGAGIVHSVGSEKDKQWIGRKVLINPSLNWGQRRRGHGKDFGILGMPSQGTFAQYVCVPVENILPMPPSFTYQQAAAIPLGGLTAYRALFYRGEAEKGQSVLITGIGGGVATLLLQFAVAAGLKVYVTSSSDQKIQKAITFKALAGFNYTNPHWDDELLEAEPDGFDLIIDSAGGENFPLLLKLIRTGGKLVTYGGTAGKIPEMIPRKIFWNQLSILGTTMGSPEDFLQMLIFIAEQRITPIIDKTFPFNEIQLAFDYMKQQNQFGKIVITFEESPK